jgi:hypothetical protein
VRAPSGRFLHHNLVVSLLNDLFGIQARGGCSCAGPYGHRLLGIDLERSHEFEREISGGCEGIKPGWVRVNFNYFISEAVFRYVVAAVSAIADHGWALIDDYSFDPITGLWQHRAGAVEPPLRLGMLHYDDNGRLQYPHTRQTAPEESLQDYLRAAHDLLHRRAGAVAPAAQPSGLSADFETLRWFDLTASAAQRGATQASDTAAAQYSNK